MCRRQNISHARDETTPHIEFVTFGDKLGISFFVNRNSRCFGSGAQLLFCWFLLRILPALVGCLCMELDQPEFISE